MAQGNITGRQITVQNVPFSGTAGTSNPVGAQTYSVRILCTSAAYVRIGTGSATTADAIFAANYPEVYVITPGQTISSMQVAAAGVLSITELS